MNEIDKIIKTKFQEDTYMPTNTQNIINQTLEQNKNTIIKKKAHKMNIINKIITIITSIMAMLLGSVTVYAAVGGTIAGKPVIEWIGLGFSNEYENYKVDVEGQEVANKETTIDLVSTVCDDGFTILEFDVKLSKEDKEYLRLGESIITEEDIEQEKKKYKEEYNIEFDENHSGLMEFKGVTNTVELEFSSNFEAPENQAYNILIDNQGYYIKGQQTTSKISEYEYKVYQMYFLTDKELNGKTNFKLTLKLDGINNIGNKDDYIGEKDFIILNTENNSRKIDTSGEFNVEVSKDKALENTKIVDVNCESAKYKGLTKSVDEVKVTPLQIIIKLKTQIDNVSLQSLSSTMNKDYIGIIDYNVYDTNGNKLNSFDIEKQRTITYSNGITEEWAPGDIGAYKDFYGATMNLTEYIIIEKKDNIQGIKIVPTVREPDFSNERYEEKNVDLTNFDINL